MPQEFRVVRCYNCNTFQVDQVKKAIKWICKICHEKQSLKKIYGLGSGKDCRNLVQKLNLERGEIEEKTSNETRVIPDIDTLTNGDDLTINEIPAVTESTSRKRPNWSKYLEPEDETAFQKSIMGCFKNEEQLPQNAIYTTDTVEYFSQRDRKKRRRDDCFDEELNIAKKSEYKLDNKLQLQLRAD